ncbi:hypothetical protein RB201_36970 [Streptomyces sp. S1A(2023)]
MTHTTDSLAAELRRLRDRPSTAVAPPVLSLFAVDVSGGAAEYGRRLRSVLSAAVRLGRTADFEQENLPVDGVPDWFAAVSPGSEERAAPQFARAGRDGYVTHTGGGRPWELHDWLHPFRSRRELPGLGVVGRHTGRAVPRPPLGGQLGGILLRMPGTALGRLDGGGAPPRRSRGSPVRRVVGGAERQALTRAAH